MTRMFEFQDGTSAKFWEITLEDCELKTRYGKLGTNGQSTNKTFETTEKAKKELEKLIKEKIGKGYSEPGAITAPETMYLEHHGLNKFFEISENNHQLRIRRGTVGQPCLVFHAGFRTKGRENFERLVKEWKQKGFVPTQPSTPILEGSIADELIAADIEDHPTYSRLFNLGWGEELRGQQKRIFVFRNGLNFQGHLELEEIADMGLTTGLIVDGDVNVTGVLSQLTYTYPNPILITGNVTAQSLGHKDSHMRIDGDVRVENIVYGEYNDGSLEIGGSVYGNAWISADHSMWAGGTYHLPSFYDKTEGLSPKVLTLEGGLDWDALRECILAGQSPLRKDFVFIPPEPETRQTELITSETDQQVPGEVVQISLFSEAAPEIQRIIETMSAGAVKTLKTLETPPALELFPPHSHVLLINALLKNLDHEGTYLPVIERLLELGTNPFLEDKDGRNLVDDSLALKQPEVIALYRRYYPKTDIWVIPSGGQVTEPEEAHPKIRDLINIEDWESMLQALEIPPDEYLIQSHSWFLLINLLRRADAVDAKYNSVIERLLELGADPRAQFEGMSMSVVRYAELLEADEILEMFYEKYPALRPEPAPENQVFGVKLLHQLIELEDAGTDFASEEIKQKVLDPVSQLHVAVERLKGIPQSLGKLQNLKSLRLVMIDFHGKRILDFLSQLVNLEDLVLGFSSFTDLPDLSGLTKLKEISLRGNKFKNLPALPVNLERLILDLNPFKEPPNLANLVHLKDLSLDGVAVVPIGLENLVNLEQLSWIDAKLETFPESLLRLPKLRTLVMSGNHFGMIPNLQGLPELETLDLQNCRFERLPDGLLELPKLEKLFLAGNSKLEKLVDKTKDVASLKVLEELRERGVKFIAEDSNESDYEASNPLPKTKDTRTRNALKQVKGLNKQAHKFQTAQPASITQALEQYQQVLKIAQPFLTDFAEDFVYDYLFALQGKLWCVNELAEQDPTRTAEAIALARSVLEFTQDKYDMHYSEIGQLSRAAQTLAHNSLSWYLLQSGADLNQALEHVNAAIEEIDYSSEEGTFAVVLENKVKILLALERSDEAYTVVYQMYRKFPTLAYFKQLTQTTEYQRWDAEN
jgi:predicted DNA-binding WGR domain protein/Leucine-rich repeat (LRR) protein